MKKTIATLVGLGLLAAAGPAASAPTLAVTDTTGALSGSYVKSQDDPSTPENEYSEGYQQGYVGVYTNTSGPAGNGVVACNGSNAGGNATRGSLWVGDYGYQSNQYSQTVMFAPLAGWTRTDQRYSDGGPTGKSPCQDENPDGANE